VHPVCTAQAVRALAGRIMAAGERRRYEIALPLGSLASRFCATDYRLPTTDYRLPTTDYRLPTTDYRLLTTAEPRPQRPHRESRHRIRPIRRKFCERLKDERSFTEAGMRDDDVRFINRHIAIQDEVEIECPRRIGGGANPAELPLYVEERIKQLARHEGGDTSRGGIEESRLVRNSDGSRVVQRRHAHVVEVGRERGNCVAKGALSVTQVATQSDRDASPSNYQLPTTN